MELSEAPSLCGIFTERLSITGASISVFDNSGRQISVCSTDALATRLDEVQFELGVGPSWEAMRTVAPVMVEDVAVPGPSISPLFGAALVGLPVHSIFAFPMVIGAVVVGVVSLYRDRPALLSEFEVEHATVITRQVTGTAVRLALRSAEADTEPGGRTLAPTMRREVHQATGILSVHLDLTATEAFLRLRAHSFSTGRSIQEIAHDVVSRVLDFRDLATDDGD
jgi:hypothetical protein